MVTGFETRMRGNRHHITRAKNGRANWRGCVTKAPFGATLSPKLVNFVCLDGNGRVYQVTPAVTPPFRASRSR